MSQANPTSRRTAALRLAVFLALGFITLQILAQVLHPLTGLLIASVLGAFGGAAIANVLALRIYEAGRLPDIGLHWTPDSARHLGFGLTAGATAALLVLGLPLIAGAARWKTAADTGASGIGAFVFVSLVLLFGAVGEEMLFRGYGFQVLVPAFGPAATLLPMSVLFAAAHASNQGVSWLGLFNTFAWGILLGAAVLRSGDLWLAIGLHFGWNWMLPILGVNLSGFTMRVTGVELEWNISELWSGGDYGPEGGLLCTIVLGALVAFLVKAPIRRQHLALLGPREEAV